MVYFFVTINIWHGYFLYYCNTAMMNSVKLLPLFTALFIAINCPAQTDEKEEQIDREYKTCMGSDTSAGTVSNCAYIAYDKWQNEMDKYYNRIVKDLRKPTDKASFKQSQEAWLAFKDAEFASYNHMFNIQGSKWYILRLTSRIDVLRERTLQLKKYYEIIDSERALFDRKK